MGIDDFPLGSRPWNLTFQGSALNIWVWLKIKQFGGKPQVFGAHVSTYRSGKPFFSGCLHIGKLCGLHGDSGRVPGFSPCPLREGGEGPHSPKAISNPTILEHNSIQPTNLGGSRGRISSDQPTGTVAWFRGCSCSDPLLTKTRTPRFFRSKQAEVAGFSGDGSWKMDGFNHGAFIRSCLFGRFCLFLHVAPVFVLLRHADYPGTRRGEQRGRRWSPHGCCWTTFYGFACCGLTENHT